MIFMMTVKQVFELGLKLGMAKDPRGTKAVAEHLVRKKKEFADLKPSEKEYFDQDLLHNPYPDSLIHVDNGKTNVKRLLAGIDIGTGEILLASELTERGKKIDLVIAHHPEGKALAMLHEVMDMSVEVYERQGVPVHLAEKIMEERIKEVGRGVHPLNHFQAVDIARILGVNFINTHTFTDNLVNQFLIDHIKKAKPRTLGDLMETLMEIPEFKAGKKMGRGPKIISGSPSHRVGNFLVEMTGGTNPSNKVYQPLSQYGISTIVGMHMKDEAIQKANEGQLNIILTGHMTSDSLGMNLYLDELEKKGIEIIPCGGLVRVSRNKK